MSGDSHRNAWSLSYVVTGICDAVEACRIGVRLLAAVAAPDPMKKTGKFTACGWCTLSRSLPFPAFFTSKSYIPSTQVVFLMPFVTFFAPIFASITLKGAELHTVFTSGVGVGSEVVGCVYGELLFVHLLKPAPFRYLLARRFCSSVFFGVVMENFNDSGFHRGCFDTKHDSYRIS